ncbi:hypothetical protein [Noviherbaspirillum sp.]|uniref:hypothetical protein n=1 Tax=Noviherbaspirillum sp. TaxID=1926288 RepID=UPI002D426761|nr:hypothetical protein [Noviherbaspirillum sp.]HZW20236.1 hypothetical protein [Noviherbaspirillum sp.]
MTEFRGARGSNTGDDFHELWATRHAIRLLANNDDLEALTVEGLAATDEAGTAVETWDGVDCALYFGGRDAATARHVVLEQLKYSAATPDAPWTVARLAGGMRRDKSVIARLAKAWHGLRGLRQGRSDPDVVLISNQPVDQEVVLAFARSAKNPSAIPTRKPGDKAAAEAKLAYAAGLDATEFQAFSASIRFEAGAGSRFALEEQVLRTIADWTDHDVQRVVTDLRQFVRHRMRPEFAGEVITRESVTLRLGTSHNSALFPCPPQFTLVKAPVSRAPVREATELLLSGVQRLCLHGTGGVGKTTALQEIEGDLPAGSIMIKYDCYGGGRYLDPSALRHRPADAFLQLTNELAANLKLPLLLTRHQGSDYPRLFATRLKHAAEAVAAQTPGALVVVAVDAADNAITAANSRVPEEPCFIRDFIGITGQPENVRFIVTARTGRLSQLQLPTAYRTIRIAPFLLSETRENVCRVWAAPDPWIEDFHHLSGGVPRVQAYALETDGAPPSSALDRLRPTGKSLDDIFQQQFDKALSKSGNRTEVARLCAGLIALPRPVPLHDLAAVLSSTEAQLADVCADLAPGIRTNNGTVSFADEDFEDFVRNEGTTQLGDIHQAAASRLLARAAHDPYAAMHVAPALISANRGAELLELVEREPAPAAVTDPVLRREAELLRLRLAIKVCREAGDVPRAMRFVVIGAEGIKTEAALRQLLVDNPDMAARFAQETAGRLILSDSDHIESHGPLLFQKLSVDAEQGDAISVREGRRLLSAWMQARKHHYDGVGTGKRRAAWDISISDISSLVEAALRLEGPEAAVQALQSWTPKRIALDVAVSLPLRLVAEDRIGDLEAIIDSGGLGPIGELFILTPLALAGRPVDLNLMARGLTELCRRKLKLQRFFNGYHDGDSLHRLILDTCLTACEVLTGNGFASELVDGVLNGFLDPMLRRIDRRYPHEGTKLDFLFRAYALRETRAGRKPATKNIFEPRPEPIDDRERRQAARHAEEHDRPLLDLTGAVFGIYAATADALVNRKSAVELDETLRSAVTALEREAWRLTREPGSTAMREHAAASLLVLLAAGYDPQKLKAFATKIHGRWQLGNSIPNEQLVARLSLRQELHASLLQDVAAAAAETHKMRIGADDKSKALVTYARLIKPVSAADANAIFNCAVEAASDLDQEAMAQIRLLNELIVRGTGRFSNTRATAHEVADVIADAAIRLDGYDHFPWHESMSAMVRLDAPLALANAARWCDEAVVPLRDTLPDLLKIGLQNGLIRPAQGVAVALLLNQDQDVLTNVLEQAVAINLPNLPTFIEEAAHDALVRHGQHYCKAVTGFIEQHGSDGLWTGALRRQNRFLSQITSEPPANVHDQSEPAQKADDNHCEHVWDRDTLLDSSRLQSTVKALRDRARSEGKYVPVNVILEGALNAVLPRDRVAYLSALAEVENLTVTDDAAKALLQAVDAWRDSPAVKEWCRTRLPDVIVKRLPELSHYLQFGNNQLSLALKRTELPDARLPELILRGIELHVDGFASEHIFALAGLAGRNLSPADAAGVAEWYASRLANRIPAEHRDQTAPEHELPQNIDEAVARFLYAFMGDCDLRMRWRAAHAVRRLARTNDVATLIALTKEYQRRTEEVFRGRRLPFYWLAARLWFALSWDRIAEERPDIASHAGPVLLQIALDETFPHLLVRSFARDACEKLVATKRLSLSPEEESRLRRVNEPPVSRMAQAETAEREFERNGFSQESQTRRFEFNWMDTIPYWYQPILSTFADVDGERFLQEVEHWIIDVWGYSGDIRAFDKEPRRERFQDWNWRLSSHSHGSKPTVERLHDHLEWHAMWCAAGELMKSAPLVKIDSDDDWHDMLARIRREKLSEPPLWSIDLLTPIPLVMRNWQADKRPRKEWTLAVEESYHRAEIFPEDQMEYVVVAGDAERRTNDRLETVSIASALVAPGTGNSLLRALQTMGDTWDYKLPDEDEDSEIAEDPYLLLGWLQRPRRDIGIDEKDPLRGSASTIMALPGRRVSKACSLSRDHATHTRWISNLPQPPMFVHEVWGERTDDDDQYTGNFAAAGWRLLVHKGQLQEFLRNQGLDLIIEVGVIRRGRENRRYSGDEEDKTPEGRFDRLYRLCGGGTLEVAEGCLGTWAGDCPRT